MKLVCRLIQTLLLGLASGCAQTRIIVQPDLHSSNR
jgi:hypothetical protein